jgi:hypothetical protein
MRRAAVRELLEGYFDGSEEELLQFLQRRPEEPPAVHVADRIDTVLL